jgi:hypothetical protein
MGFMAARRTIGSPLVVPPSRPPARPPADGVLGLGAGQPRHGEPLAELHALDGVDAQDRLRQQPVELAVPLRVATQAGGHADGSHLEDAAQRLAGLLGRIDACFHALGGLRVGAAHLRRLRAGE